MRASCRAIAKQKGSIGDKAKAAGEAIKDPGAAGPDKPRAGSKPESSRRRRQADASCAGWSRLGLTEFSLTCASTWSGRTSGIDLGRDIPSTNLYDFISGKIKRIRIFLDHHEALEAAGLVG